MLKIIDHPIIKIKLTKLRDKNTDRVTFKKNLTEIISLMIYEIFKNYQPKKKINNILTPTNNYATGFFFDKEIVLIPVLRAGLGMLESFYNIIPEIKVGFIGLLRNETNLNISEYFLKIPKVKKDSEIIILDIMLATGSSAIEAINKLKKNKFSNIKIICLLTCPEGIKNLISVHKDVEIYTVCVDKKLNDKNFIIPGLGDAGDRLFEN